MVNVWYWEHGTEWSISGTGNMAQSGQCLGTWHRVVNLWDWEHGTEWSMSGNMAQSGQRLGTWHRVVNVWEHGTEWSMSGRISSTSTAIVDVLKELHGNLHKSVMKNIEFLFPF